MGRLGEQNGNGRDIEKGAPCQAGMLVPGEFRRQKTQALEHEPKRERGHRHRVQLVPYIGKRGSDDSGVTHAKLRVRYNVIEIQRQLTPERAFR